MLAAPAGSGKTVLLRSWIAQSDLTRGAAWVAAGRDCRDPQHLWLSVVRALRQTDAGSVLVQPVTAAPDLDGWTLMERLLTNLSALDDQLWLVIDDVHELDADALRQLELLIMRATPTLRFVLATRRDVRLGLHRLRLEGELAEIRGTDLRFSVAETGELFAAAGMELPEATVASLQERTEGWAAGLRLAALSLAGHPDPGRFAAGFSGTERTVAEYLLAEVLDRQSERVRRLLLRTSILERINGDLADLLTGDDGTEAVLQDLVWANAFVVPLDGAPSWFRYHQMFADLLRLELRRVEPREIAALHLAAATWFAAHGYPVDAVRHAQAAQDWGLAVRLLADHWPALHLDGGDATTRELLTSFPDGMRAANAELTALTAAAELAQGSLNAAEQYLERAERELTSVPTARHRQASLLLGIVRLVVARRRGNLPAVAAEAERLLTIPAADAPGAPPVLLGQDLRALALINLGITEYWTAKFAEATQHLDQGRVLAQRIGRPYLEFSGLGYQAAAQVFQSFAVATQRSGEAIELAAAHGWTDKPAAGLACMAMGAVLAWQGRPELAEPWVQRAELVLSDEARPGSGLAISYLRGVLSLAHGQDAEALAAFQAGIRQAGLLAAPNLLSTVMHAFVIQILTRLGETQDAEDTLARLGEQERERGEIRITTAMLCLAQGDPRSACAELAPVVGGAAPLVWPAWMTQAALLEAIARDALGDADAADQALEEALGCAEPDGVLLWFQLHPAPGLLERHARHRTAHAALIGDIQNLLAGKSPAARPAGPRQPAEALSETELRVLRYLPTNLTAPEIASELYVSRHTVKTHMRHLYAKLGAHRRAEAIARARDLGLLAPSARQR